jgi:membrane protein involved in colicin uptake
MNADEKKKAAEAAAAQKAAEEAAKAEADAQAAAEAAKKAEEAELKALQDEENAAKAAKALTGDTGAEKIFCVGVGRARHDPFQNLWFKEDEAEAAKTEKTPWVQTQLDAGILKEVNQPK